MPIPLTIINRYLTKYCVIDGCFGQFEKNHYSLVALSQCVLTYCYLFITSIKHNIHIYIQINLKKIFNINFTKF